MKNREFSARRRLVNATVLVGLAVAGAALGNAWPAAAGTGHSWVAYRPAPRPCSGDSCQADDPRSGSDCQGLLCTFSSSKAMQPPMTAARAEDLVRQRAAADAAKPIAEPPAPTKPRKRLATRKTTSAPKTVAPATAPSIPATETAAAR